MRWLSQACVSFLLSQGSAGLLSNALSICVTAPDTSSVPVGPIGSASACFKTPVSHPARGVGSLWHHLQRFFVRPNGHRVPRIRNLVLLEFSAFGPAKCTWHPAQEAVQLLDSQESRSPTAFFLFLASGSGARLNASSKELPRFSEAFSRRFIAYLDEVRECSLDDRRLSSSDVVYLCLASESSG